MPEPGSGPIVLYDGVCGLCNRAVQFLLKRDRHDQFRFAPLQSSFAADLLKRHDLSSTDLDTVYAVRHYGKPDEQLLAKGDAVLFFGEVLGGIWRITRLARILPRRVRDRLYDFVARNRYRVFGKSESCMLPDPAYKHKFLEG